MGTVTKFQIRTRNVFSHLNLKIKYSINVPISAVRNVFGVEHSITLMIPLAGESVMKHVQHRNISKVSADFCRIFSKIG